jgi:hypothetical protein
MRAQVRRAGVTRGVRRRSLVLGALAGAGTARGDEPAVDLLLVLAVDASGSVSMERFALQRDGYVAAFRHPRLIQAIARTPGGAIAATMTQWTGPTMQLQVVDWTRLSDAASCGAFADAIARAPRQLFGGGTSISGAILHAAGLIGMAPFAAPRRVIDVSGDGANNRGRPAEEARDGAVAAGMTVNGLPILALEPNLDAYYRDHVIGGPGAFLVVARDFDDFERAVLRKLVQEIASPGLAPDQGGAPSLGPS